MGLVSLVLPALLAGCATSERSTSATTATTATSAAGEQPPMATAAKAPAKGAGGTGNAGIAKVSGVDSCDEYLHVYERCVAERLTGEQRTEHASKLVQVRASVTKRASAAAAADRQPALEAKCKHGLASLPAACGS